MPVPTRAVNAAVVNTGRITALRRDDRSDTAPPNCKGFLLFHVESSLSRKWLVITPDRNPASEPGRLVG